MTNFPEALDTLDDLFIASDRASSHLSAGVTDTDLSILVSDGSKFPTGRFIVAINAELLIVSSRAGETFTIEQRGAFGTTAASYPAGTLVSANFTAAHWNTMAEAMVNVQKPLKLLREPVTSATLADPPATPALDEQYIIAAPASGVWAGQEGKIARQTATGWTFISPDLGTMLFDQETGTWLMFGATGWQETGGGGKADQVEFDGTTSGSTAANVQEALDDLYTMVPLFEISLSLTGGVYADELLGTYVATRPYRIALDLAGAVGDCQATPTINTSISLRKNGVEFGLVSLTANAMTFTGFETDFVPGDILTFISTDEVYFTSLTFTLSALRQ